ncbi:hypothetical protein GCM10010909_25380 [Acidocella aquatica]|uniref:Uncharacterized protein n=1 Tax=Acidocella aquatica TaxID=1922313 RepID=A0ABQ6A9A6_9PROT|nr:hypothetical protein GCM10010909_25380 [Acidocella aquatica]
MPLRDACKLRQVMTRKSITRIEGVYLFESGEIRKADFDYAIQSSGAFNSRVNPFRVITSTDDDYSISINSSIQLLQESVYDAAPPI